MPTSDNAYDLACEANDAYRRMRMNVKYYGFKLARLQRISLIADASVAIGTSGTVASMAVWHTGWGGVLFAILALSSAVTAVARPIMDLSGRISRCSKMWSAYNSLHSTLERIVRDMRANQSIRQELSEAVASALDTAAALANEEDPSPSKNLRALAMAEANREIPIDRLWWPEDSPVLV